MALTISYRQGITGFVLPVILGAPQGYVGRAMARQATAVRAVRVQIHQRDAELEHALQRRGGDLDVSQDDHLLDLVDRALGQRLAIA